MRLADKEDRARIRVESIIREDFVVEAYELLEMFCELLLARFGMIQQMKELEDGIAEAVSSLIWVAPRVSHEITEFKVHYIHKALHRRRVVIKGDSGDQ